MKKSFKRIVISIIVVAMFIANSSSSSSKAQYDYKDIVVFYPQHQDDEVLWSGSTIIDAIKTRGQKNVFVVLISDGSGIKILKEDRFSNLTKEEKSQLRNNEFKRSLTKLGVAEENVIFVSKIQDDNKNLFEKMEDIVLDFEEQYEGNVTHIGHTYKLDWHEQHIKNGSVLKNLYDNKQINDCLFFIKPEYEEQIPLNEKQIIKTTNDNEYNQIKDAAYSYEIKDEENGLYGIGYKSDHKSFDRLLGNENPVSILHSPEL